MPTGLWWTEFLGGEQHLFPSQDFIVHELSPDCVCGPEVEYHHGSIYPLVRHHALDKQQRMEMK